MKDEHKASLRETTSILKLRDVVLLDAKLSRPIGNESFGWRGDAIQEHKRAVRYGQGVGEINGKSLTLATFEVELGTRVLANEVAEDGTKAVVVEIDARFLVLYETQQTVGEEAMEIFAKLNAVHIVWPFWRQHVFDLVQRAQLPKLEIPLLAGPMP
ncbi:MAG TPA: hypothetical protein DCM32_03455 [Xanthomonadaceae bacterium]|jgi:uncharacterized protein (UPF0128 family)|nr:hypothetical protein [Xanthomonadaceae bacterium]